MESKRDTTTIGVAILLLIAIVLISVFVIGWVITNFGTFLLLMIFGFGLGLVFRGADTGKIIGAIIIVLTLIGGFWLVVWFITQVLPVLLPILAGLFLTYVFIRPKK